MSTPEEDLLRRVEEIASEDLEREVEEFVMTRPLAYPVKPPKGYKQ